jgi:alkyl hydroperoxide reductase subunit AhpC/predicted Ser/Thr protein kinase
MATVGKRAPDFDLPCTSGAPSTRRHVTLRDYAERWLILVFYPRDFSLVCPTELVGLSNRAPEFRRRACDILAVGTDSIESHERWLAAPRSQGGLAGLQFPLASDEDGATSRAYGVLLEPQHVAMRGLFIVDPNGVLQYQTVHNLSVGRRGDDVLRVLAALETGGMCPEDWCVDCATLDPTTALAPGNRVAHYRIEAEVGRGSFGAVFRAYDLTLLRHVALKVFRPGGPKTSLRILDEARAAAALAHPNVCSIFGTDDSEGFPVITMEFVDGCPLTELLRNGPLSADDAARIAAQLARGMAAAHRSGVVHGDLKPANVLLNREMTVKITDFGLARRLIPTTGVQETQDWDINSPGAIAGTPSYMSPEQIRGAPATPESDVFSFGLIFFEMLTGKRAFDGQNVLEVLDQVRRVDPDLLAEQASERFAPIVRGALAIKPQERLTMDEIVVLLD